ncbi:hypothetical protein THASP1DRAFT_30133 [Thamnocephalis sphaerospora]|uniref:Uncharacterized protein n=1 Tax=Thamnocephalis sphaerospora TaxID=78915 RepID=A0A4V1IWM2_9FUNG|nr:hypothetical protein THASP1DRAFT_30133 [Thamnocephalis sphaerospora]|eukprot:RKP08049.1 hypothetical protein THASP1DRAFT_30133 [Thamnocephalis sphaerospora]
MRLASLVGSATAAIFASVAVAGLFVNALTPSDDAISPENLQALEDYEDGRFQMNPHFTIVQPEGTQSYIHRDRRGRIFSIEFFAADREIVREVAFEPRSDVGKYNCIEIMDFSQGREIPGTMALFRFDYDENNEKVIAYSVKTSKGWAFFSAQQNSNGANDMDVILQSTHKSFTLRNVQLWDGSGVSLALGRSVSGA